MRHDAIIFDIDDTLYDSTRMSTMARADAIEAMVDAGLPKGKDETLETLRQVIKRDGANSSRHFDELLTAMDLPPNAKIVAAGIVAYHNSKLAYLRPFEETIPTLLELRGLGYSLGVVTNGVAVKQWEKLIRLGLQHFFHTTVVSQTAGFSKPDARIFHACCEQLSVDPVHCVFVGNDPYSDIYGANLVGMLTVRMRKGRLADIAPQTDEHHANHSIDKLADLLRLIDSGAIAAPE
jgi:putative hydrolase of the HAD superfamily